MWADQLPGFLDDVTLAPGPPVLLHTEVRRPHLFAVQAHGGAWRLSGLVDFDHAIRGAREYEFVAVGIHMARGDSRFLRRLLTAYGYTRGQLDRDFASACSPGPSCTDIATSLPGCGGCPDQIARHSPRSLTAGSPRSRCATSSARRTVPCRTRDGARSVLAWLYGRIAAGGTPTGDSRPGRDGVRAGGGVVAGRGRWPSAAAGGSGGMSWSSTGRTCRSTPTPGSPWRWRTASLRGPDRRGAGSRDLHRRERRRRRLPRHAFYRYRSADRLPDRAWPPRQPALDRPASG